MKIKLSSTSILTEAEISADIQNLIKNGDYTTAYEKANAKVSDTNEKLFEIRMTYAPNDKKKTSSATSLQPFTSQYLIMKDENGKPISTRTNDLKGLLGKLFGYGKIDFETFSKYFTTSANEEDAFISTEENINKIIKQLEKGFGKDAQLVKLQARPGDVSNEKDEVINAFLESVNIDKERIKNYRGEFINDCATLGFDETRNPIIYWVKEVAQTLNLTKDKYSIIHNLWSWGVITSDDLKNKNDDSIVFNKSLYSNTWVNIEWIITAYKQAFVNLNANTLLSSDSTQENPKLYSGTLTQFKNEAFFGKQEANPCVDTLRSRREIAEFCATRISKEGITQANSKVGSKRSKETSNDEEETITKEPTQRQTRAPKEIKETERWQKVLQDTNNSNLNKKEIEDFKRYLTSISTKK